MQIDEARARFVEAWGRLGTEWGVNRTMAQIHALLLVSPEPLDTERIMEELRISRGNANTNLRALIDWELVTRETRPGVRREFFRAEKDVWEIARRIVVQRRRRELDPLVAALRELAEPDEDPSRAAEVREFRERIRDVRDLAVKSNRVLDLVLAVERSAFFRGVLKVLGR
jgi:DNA-binding transcriptional regulator GbsR (MarR family)